MKKQHFSVLYVVLISLLLGSTILLSKPSDKSEYAKFAGVVDNRNKTYNHTDNSVNAYEGEILRKEPVEIINNSNDIDMQANLIEDTSGQVSLDFKYKENGKIIFKIIDTSEIPEIRNIFRFREQTGNGYTVSNMFFNTIMGKLYFCIEGKKKEKYTHTAIYSYELQTSKVEKVIHYLGEFGAFHTSPDGRYITFSYISCPQEIARNEKSTVVILRCSDDKLLLNSNENMIVNDLNIYSYDFIQWKKNNTCELRQVVKAKDGSQKVRNKTIYYNVNNSALIY